MTFNDYEKATKLYATWKDNKSRRERLQRMLPKPGKTVKAELYIGYDACMDVDLTREQVERLIEQVGAEEKQAYDAFTEI